MKFFKLLQVFLFLGIFALFPVFSQNLQNQQEIEGSSTNSASQSENQNQNQNNNLDLSLEDAIKAAINGNISLKESQVSVKAAQRAKNYSWNSVSPSLQASARMAGPSTDPSTLNDTASLYFGGTVSFALSPSIFTNIKSAALSYDQSLMTYENAKNTIELNVRKAYYSILYEMESVKLQEQNFESARQQYESNLARYNRGTLSRLDVLSAQVTYQNAGLTLESSKVTLENDLASFKQTLGISQDKQLNFTDDFSEIRKIKAISVDGLETNPYSINSLEKQIEVAENSLLATRFSAWGPTISASYAYNYSGLLSDTQNLSGASSYSLGVSIPLDGYLPWSQGSQSIANQKDNLETLQLELEDAKTSLNVSVQNYLKKIKQTQDSISLRVESINLAQQTFEMTQEAYNYGTKDLLSLQSASDNLLSAKLNLMSEEYTLISTIFELENTLGIPFGTLGR